MSGNNNQANAINRQKKASKPTALKVNKARKKRKPRFIPMDTRNMLSKSERTRVERPSINSRSAARDHIKSLVTSLLSSTDMSPGEGVRVPRISSRPVAARKIPFSFKIPQEAFSNGKIQLRFAPDLYRTCSYTHTSSGAVAPAANGVWSDLNFILPQGQFCLNPDIKADNGRVFKFDAVKISNDITYFTGNMNTDTPVNGAEALLFESIDLPAVGFKFVPTYSNYTGDDVAMTCRLLALSGAGLNSQRTVLYTLASVTTTVANGVTSNGSFADAAWTTFVNAVNASSMVKGLCIAYEITNASGGGVVRDSVVVGLDWSAAKPLFGDSPTWQVVSVFDTMGSEGTTLKAELDNVQFGAVTQMNVRFTDFVATMNQNGIISATQMPACKLKGIPTVVEDALTAIENIGIPEYSWKSLPEKEGLTWVCHFDSNEQWVRRPSKYLINRGANLDDVDIPMAVIAADFSANINPDAKHVLNLIGSLNYEWETSSLAFDLKFPPSNFSLFNEAYFQAVSRECPFTHNPTHVREIAKKIINVMKHPVMQHVIKTVAEVGLSALMSV